MVHPVKHVPPRDLCDITDRKEIFLTLCMLCNPSGDTVFDFAIPAEVEDSLLVPFVIMGTELIVGALAQGSLDFETRSEYDVPIVATDFGTPPLSLRINVTINVVNVNEAPTNISLSNISFPENLPVNGSIASVAVEDPDNAHGVLQTHACTVENAHGDFFIDDENILRLFAGNVDYERQREYRNVLITCTDTGVPALSLVVSTTLAVINVNENPIGITLSANTVRENSPAGTIVGTLTTSDPDTLSVDRSAQAAFTYQFRTPSGTRCGSDSSCPFAVEGSGACVLLHDCYSVVRVPSLTGSVLHINNNDMLTTHRLVLTRRSLINEHVAVLMNLRVDFHRTASDNSSSEL